MFLLWQAFLSFIVPKIAAKPSSVEQQAEIIAINATTAITAAERPHEC